MSEKTDHWWGKLVKQNVMKTVDLLFNCLTKGWLKIVKGLWKWCNISNYAMIKGKNSNGKFRKLYYLMSKTPLLSDLNSIQLKLELKTHLFGLLKEEDFFYISVNVVIQLINMIFYYKHLHAYICIYFSRWVRKI